MDGIPSGHLLLTPTLPGTMQIGDKGSVHAPPVEILPIPDNSFAGGSGTAEILKDSFSQILDGRGTGNGDVRGGKAAGRTAGVPVSRTAAEGTPVEDDLSRAYTLSLGDSEDAQVTPQIARELMRAKNYEHLGRTGGRQVSRMSADPGADVANPPGAGETKTTAFMSGRIKSLLTQPMPAGFEGESAASMSGSADMPKAANMPKTASTPVSLNTPLAEEADAAPIPQKTGAQSGPVAMRLTPSDYETIRSLEPELREALVNMLGSEDFIPTPPGMMSAPFGKAGTSAKNAVPVPAGNLPQAGQPDALPASSAEGPASRLTAAFPAAVAARGMPEGGASSSGMANLQKIAELPYALYLFGGISPDKRPPAEDDASLEAAQPVKPAPAYDTEFLRLSDAVKMAAVLHSIYHGGSGAFTRGAPWYDPYVSYAVKNGIIRSGEFDDLNAYATRAETAYIFSGCVPKAEFPVVNYTPGLQDVDEDAGYGAYIYLLCRAGVFVCGKDGRFHPESMITRTEAAGLIGRIATPGDRKNY